MDELSSPSRFEPDVAASPTASLRTLIYNARHCRGAFSPFISEARTAAVVRKCRPDVAGLTEIYRWSKRDQPTRLAEGTGCAPLFFGVRCVHGGEYGNLLLTRFPVREIARIPLPGRGEPRGCLLAEMDSELGTLTVGVTHLGLSVESRRAQLEELLRLLPTDRPLILMGDFNCRLHELTPLLGLLSTLHEPPATFPSLKPVFPLDLVLFSRHFTPRVVDVPFSLASDHRPVAVELALSTQP